MSKSLLACALALAACGSAHAANIVLVNADPAGAGLNDPTPAAPIGDNPGTTIGEQRRIAYQFAADLWGSVLESDVTVRVRASFAPLDCNATGGVLGSAGATRVFRDFAGAPLAATWYHSALADALVGVELSPEPGFADITSRFNANLGTPGCLTASGWYYGIDGKTPGNRINFLDVVMHEIGHGLGFQGFDRLDNGAFLAGFPNVYGANVRDNTTGLAWNALTPAQRVVAATGNALVWTGAEVTSQVPVALEQVSRLSTTGTLVANFAINPASYGPFPTAANFNGDTVLVNDGVGATADGCEPSPAGSLAGKVALVDRGNCTFKTKTLNAQNAGATEVIVANNVAAGFPGMGDDPMITAAITIPSIGVELATGNALKGALPGVNAALVAVPNQFYGSDTSGRARLFAPNPVQFGSSFSHWDVTHAPNALMEPSNNQDLDAQLRVDLSPALYADEGWTLNADNGRIQGCNTRVDVVEDGGVIAGAFVQASDALCRASSANKPLYIACMVQAQQRLREAGAINALQGSGILRCAATSSF